MEVPIACRIGTPSTKWNSIYLVWESPTAKLKCSLLVWVKLPIYVPMEKISSLLVGHSILNNYDITYTCWIAFPLSRIAYRNWYYRLTFSRLLLPNTIKHIYLANNQITKPASLHIYSPPRYVYQQPITWWPTNRHPPLTPTHNFSWMRLRALRFGSH